MSQRSLRRPFADCTNAEGQARHDVVQQRQRAKLPEKPCPYLGRFLEGRLPEKEILVNANMWGSVARHYNPFECVGTNAGTRPCLVGPLGKMIDER